MNIALEKAEEFVNGNLRRSYGDAFVRGNNGSLNRRFFFYVPILIDDPVLYISAS